MGGSEYDNFSSSARIQRIQNRIDEAKILFQGLLSDKEIALVILADEVNLGRI